MYSKATVVNNTVSCALKLLREQTLNFLKKNPQKPEVIMETEGDVN